MDSRLPLYFFFFLILKRWSVSSSADLLSTFWFHPESRMVPFLKAILKLKPSRTPQPASSPTTAPVNRSFQNLHWLPVPWRTHSKSRSFHLQSPVELTHSPTQTHPWLPPCPLCFGVFFFILCFLLKDIIAMILSQKKFLLPLLQPGSLFYFFLHLCVDNSDAGTGAARGAGEGGYGCPGDASRQWRQIWNRDHLLHPGLCQRAGRNSQRLAPDLDRKDAIRDRKTAAVLLGAAVRCTAGKPSQHFL